MTRSRNLSGFLIIFLTLLSILIVFIIGGCSRGSQNGANRNNSRPIPAVEIVQVHFGSLPLTQRLSGLVKAKNQVELYPQISAAIEKIFVQNGTLVKAGDPLIQLRDTEFREQLKQAEASYQIALAQHKQAQAEYSRIQGELKRANELFDKNLSSPTELETIQTRAIGAEADAELAQARVQQAQATVDEHREELSRTIIRAPVAGTVGNRNAEVGMLVSPSTRLFTLGQLDSVQIEVILTDRMLNYIKEGQRSEILVHNSLSTTLTAPVTRISPFLHPVTHSTKAEIDMDNSDGLLLPGMFVTVDIFYGESEQAPLIPLSALWENPNTGITGVFLAQDSINSEPIAGSDESGGQILAEPIGFKFVPIDIIAKGRLNAGIEGVNPGNWVITIGQDLITSDSGQARVRVVSWDWVQKLQQMQREDLLEEIIKRQQGQTTDTIISAKLTAVDEAG